LNEEKTGPVAVTDERWRARARAAKGAVTVLEAVRSPAAAAARAIVAALAGGKPPERMHIQEVDEALLGAVMNPRVKSGIQPAVKVGFLTRFLPPPYPSRQDVRAITRQFEEAFFKRSRA
jgi:hypothetical protein